MTLDEIALKYKTDKSSAFHNYTEKYEQYFSNLRDKPIKLLEIGIQNGYSLKTWKEYFSQATIYGMDIVDCSQMDEERVHTLKGSQNDLNFLKKINEECGPFDIIIDDGSHNSADMKISFDFLFPLLKNGGLYVIEDLHCVYWPELSDGGTVLMDRLKELLDLTNSNGKCGIADIKNIEKDTVYKIKKVGVMNWWEQSIEFIHLYRSIVFIKKYNTAPPYSNPPIKKLGINVLIKRFFVKVYGRLIHTKNIFIEKISSMRSGRLPLTPTPEIAEYRKKIKVCDVFTYNGEKDVLEIRLNILNKVVDQFIIVEAPTTFSGKKKPLYFESQKDQFAEFLPKIKYFVIDDYPNDLAICELANRSSNVPKDGPEHWRREFYQKESIKKALLHLEDNDFCFIGDADEIWNPDVVIDWRGDDIFKLKQKFYAYFLNNRANLPWAGTIATKYKNIKNACLNHLRTKGKTHYTYIPNGGWHFTNMGGLEEVRRKLDDSYTAESYNTEEVQKNLAGRFGITDYLGRKIRFHTDESELPPYLLQNKNRYSNLFKS
jgi:hypothetical protein